MERLFGPLYLQNRFFVVLTALVLGFLTSYMVPGIYGSLKLLFYVFVLLILADLLLLFASKGGIGGSRAVPDKLSNGDMNPLEIHLVNHYLFPVKARVIDELPVQFQKRDFFLESPLKRGEGKVFQYVLRPVERGVYGFGGLNIFAISPLGLLARRYRFGQNQEVPVYPSFLQVKKYELLAFTNKLHSYGLKKIRRIGHTMEFEQIKDYVLGDDIRNLNWKATAKRGSFMVNQYQDEKSQPIYSVIDKGRVMKMPFNGLSLLDYAINTSLVISNIALKKNDKAGVFAFSDKVGNRVVAERRGSQMNLILENLYKLRTDFIESDFSRLYVDVKRSLNQRSLLLLYTNFETLDALHRQLPYLMALSKQHLLVVIFFENTELDEFAEGKAQTVQQLYQRTMAQKFVHEKKRIVAELGKYGIQALLTKPGDLTVKTINKYLEIKARGLI